MSLKLMTSLIPGEHCPHPSWRVGGASPDDVGDFEDLDVIVVEEIIKPIAVETC